MRDRTLNHTSGCCFLRSCSKSNTVEIFGLGSEGDMVTWNSGFQGLITLSYLAYAIVRDVPLLFPYVPLFLPCLFENPSDR
jgi:hypothetical protein